MLRYITFREPLKNKSQVFTQFPDEQSSCCFVINNLLLSLEITLMESDVLSDDLVETLTFDLSDLQLDKVLKKTFKFRQVFS